MPRPREEQRYNNCASCYFWTQTDTTEDGELIGSCHINPPLVGNEFSQADWPRTLGADWCGAYRRGVVLRPTPHD